MPTDLLINFVSILVTTLQILIIIRVLMSWVNPNPASGPARFLHEVTEPVLAPARKLIPSMAGIDLSPILTLVVIQILGNLIINLLA